MGFNKEEYTKQANTIKTALESINKMAVQSLKATLANADQDQLLEIGKMFKEHGIEDVFKKVNEEIKNAKTK